MAQFAELESSAAVQRPLCRGGGAQVTEQALRKAELFEEAGMPAGLPGLCAHPQCWSSLPTGVAALPVGGVYTALLSGT